MKAIYGELQHHLLMAITYGNMCEPSNFGPPTSPAAPVGASIPAFKSQPHKLGIDDSVPVAWDLEVNVRSVSFAAELLPTATDAPGTGPPVAQVLIQLLSDRQSPAMAPRCRKCLQNLFHSKTGSLPTHKLRSNSLLRWLGKGHPPHRQQVSIIQRCHACWLKQ